MKQASLDISRWARGWRTAGAFLERERAERLRNMSDDEARAAVAALFFGEVTRPSSERECGLVEQQRLFRKLK